MAVSYNIIERIEPGIPGGGKRKYYARARMTGRLDIPEIIARIEKRSTLSGADIRGVIYALADVVKEGLAEGCVVEMGEIGNFRISLKSRGHTRRDEVGAKSITGAKVIYVPGKSLKELTGSLEFRKL